MWQVTQAATEPGDRLQRRGQEAAEKAAANRRTAAGLLLLLLLVGCLLLSLRPRHFYLNGERLSLSQVGSAADCAERLGISLAPGNLLDARGEVLVRGGGLPALILRKARSISPATVVRGGDLLTVALGRELTEPITTKIHLLPATPRRPDGRRVSLLAAALPFVSLQRDERGQFSGKLASVEIAQVSPVVRSRAVGQERLVALTFDDGPSSYTAQILKILDQYHVKATFFVLGGTANRNRELLRQIHAAGHEIAIHTWSHPYLTRWSSERITADMHRCLDLIHSVVGPDVQVRWMRPPYGDTNARVQAAVEAAGLRAILWDVDTSDWRRPGAGVIAERVLSRVYDGAVVLMHDGPAHREQTVEAVRRMVPALLERGYYPATLSQVKGLESVFSGEVIYEIGGRQFLVRPTASPLTVEVDGVEIDYPLAPLKCRGQIMLPAAPTFEQLGTTCVYDQATKSLLLEASTGSYRLRLDSLRAEKNGQEITLQVPPVLYMDKAFVPLWALANITAATAVWDQEAHVLRLYSPGAGPDSPGPEAAAGRWLLVAGHGDPMG